MRCTIRKQRSAGRGPGPAPASLVPGPSARAGSVLMETVIAIPIFLVTIGWTLWMGELSQGRSRLLMADRYAAWNRGNRQGGEGAQPAEVRKRLFNDETRQDVTAVRVRSRSAGWYTEVKAETRAKLAMPDWVAGMVQAGTTWDLMPTREKQRLTGRDHPHLIVLRGGARNEDKASVNWLHVASDNWWPLMHSSPPNIASKLVMQPKYDRFGTFVSWSN
jgi:hypothetical protein